MKLGCLQKYKYVSFDLFDTLITRVVSKPNDVFCFVEKIYKKENISKVSDFKSKRIECEKIARSKCKYEDVSLDEIYDELTKYYTKKEAEIIKAIEKETEISFCFRNNKIGDYYDYCVKNKIKIIINSDMYLPKETIIKILESNGYKNNYKVYVSSDTRVLKATSNMYKYILKDLNITSKDIIHIGDNIYTDIVRSKLAGINSIRVLKIKKSKSNDINTNIFENYLKLHDSGSDYFENFGYKCLGPLLYGFSYWLKEELENKKLYNVFFLAREGKIMEKAFGLINENLKIKTTYMYASRRALLVPTLDDKKILNKINYVKIHLKALLISLGLNPLEYLQISKKHGLDIEEPVYLSDKRLGDLIKEITPDINKASIKEKKLLVKYLEQINFNKAVALVDVGWFGSMQNSLESMFKSVEINGYYMGLNKEELNNKKSFLFSKNKNYNLKEQKDLFVSILEVFLTADHGSTKNFIEEKGTIIPVLFEYEYIDTKEYDYIMKSQSSALHFIEDFNKLTQGLIKIDPYLSMKNVSNVGVNPSVKDVNAFLDFSIYDGQQIRLIQSQRFANYILKPNQFIKDFFISNWKVGFLRKILGFNIKIFNILNKIYFKKNNL